VINSFKNEPIVKPFVAHIFTLLLARIFKEFVCPVYMFQSYSQALSSAFYYDLSVEIKHHLYRKVHHDLLIFGIAFPETLLTEVDTGFEGEDLI
jgi:hypothetical protein